MTVMLMNWKTSYWLINNLQMRNSIYNSEEEFSKLPPVVQKAVVSLGQLREWVGLFDEMKK